jgi:hypothetical protein
MLKSKGTSNAHREGFMIWLDMTEENGRGLYLDIRGIEPRRLRGDTVFTISGVLGDGQDEADILLEVGNEVAVVFLDEWLGKVGQGGLFARVSREELVGALVESTSGMSFCIDSFPALEGKPRQQVRGYRSNGHWLPVRPPSYGEQMELPLEVGEAAA